MQGAFELGLVAVLFLGLQAWWLSKVFLNRPRQPRRMGKPMRANSLQNDRNALEKIFKSWKQPRHWSSPVPIPMRYLKRDRGLGCKPRDEACYRHRATQQRNGEWELHGETRGFRSMGVIRSMEEKASCLLSRLILAGPNWRTIEQRLSSGLIHAWRFIFIDRCNRSKKTGFGHVSTDASHPAPATRWILADSRMMNTVPLTASGEFHTTGFHEAVSKNLTPLSATAIAFKSVTGWMRGVRFFPCKHTITKDHQCPITRSGSFGIWSWRDFWIRALHHGWSVPKRGSQGSKQKKRVMIVWWRIMIRIAFLSIWSLSTAIGFAGSLPPKDRRRTHFSVERKVKILVDNHTVCRLKPF